MKKIYLSLFLVLLGTLTRSAFAQSTSVTYGTASGTPVTFTVPVGVTSINVDMAGGAGGNAYYTSVGGAGGRVQATLTVSGGQVMNIYVGGKGTNGSSSYSSSGQTGGVGGATGGNSGYYYGAGGGGSSEIRVGGTATTNRVLVAGGGGGGGDEYCNNEPGGAGGGTTGATGQICSSPTYLGSCYNPTGGSQTGGGIATCSPYGAGSQTTGSRAYYYGGGGGGGFWSGGGGYEYAGGGGGSSYPAGTGATLGGVTVTSITHTQGFNPPSSSTSGVGYVTLCYANAGTLSGASTVCTGATTAITPSASGGTWTSSNTGIATVSSSGVVTGVSAGTVTISYAVTGACGSGLATKSLTINQTPGAISGTNTYCTGTTATLAVSPAGGTWGSTNSSQATVGSSSGNVTSISAGYPTITYSFPGGCPSSSFPITVNAQPSAISGVSTVCGSLTASLFDATPGGTWSSNNTLQATIGSTSGIVTGAAAGSPVISYIMATGGCYVTHPMTVNALSSISGSPFMCIGYGTTLTDATAGGNWSSSNPGVATIGVSSGVMSSVTVGTTIVSYTMPATGCTATQAVAVTNPPSTFSVSGGGAFCSGGSGVSIGMAGSDAGMSYTLFDGTTPISTQIGAGFPFYFSVPVTAAGTYNVVAASGTACAATMSGSATVTVNPLPTQYTVSAGGGGSYCSGGTGVHVFLSSSQIGVNYQLFLGTTPVGGPVSGTSASLDFGLQTATGGYSVVALNTTTSCTGPMANTTVVTVNPLPSAFTVSPSTGGYCTGGSGVTISLASSTTGISYQLQLGGVATGTPVSGTGTGLGFGVVTLPGTYSIVGTNASTGCTSSMSNSSVITINPLPTVFSVTGGGTSCPGTGSDVQINGSQSGVNYQLYRGGVAISPSVILAGTGSAIDYGFQTTSGSYTAVATNPTTGCTNAMTSSANVVLNPLPTVFTVTQSASSYCAGGTGVHIGLSGSVSGTSYSLYNGGTLVSAVSGTGGTIDFGLITASGTFTVKATIVATGCNTTMTGSVSVSILPLPIAYNVTVAGGGTYCAGGLGQVIGLSNTQLAVTYTLFRSGVAVGTAIAGTGSAISFPSQTVAGSYTIVATNTGTGCANNMTGSAVISILPAPTVYNVTGGGPYCAGGTGVHLGLTGSDLGISYQLLNGTPTGAPVAGLGSTIDFGLLTAAGTYTILATNTATTCTATMAGSQLVTINPLPAVKVVTTTGSSSYCAGGSGVTVGLSGSVSGVNYSLYNGTSLTGAPVPGSGSAISFGLQTATGTYTAKATNASTGCISNMTGSATINIIPTPTAYAVTGGGNLCAGSTGLHINLSGSQMGKSYQLFNGTTPVTAGLLNGSGSALDFGVITTPGTYTIVATDTITLCTANMTGSTAIVVNALPTAYVIGGGGNYCSGGTGPNVTLNNSAIGNVYQLYAGATPSGAPVAGTGSSLDFGAQSAGGSYTVIATNVATGCNSNMTGAATVGVSALPTLFNVTGGGNYCPGGPGVHVMLSGSVSGTVYQLYNGAVVAGSSVSGTGAAIDLGLQTATGAYTVVATNPSTGCTASMTGSVSVGIASLPTVYNVTGTSNYCPGGAGAHVGLTGSATGVTYQLFRGGASIGTAFTGTGASLDFGLQTTGTYTVIATNGSTTCTNNMNGSAVIGISPLPAAHTVTGGGNYCTGGTGVHVGLNGSTVSTWYQLYQGVTPLGSPMAGTGASIDFGLQTGTGVYTVVANSSTTTCTSGMTGSVTVGTSALPTPFMVSGGGSYCIGGTGVDVMLGGSAIGVNYQLYKGGTAVGGSMSGTGSSIDFGMQGAAGTYTVVAVDGTSACTSNMTSSASVVINPSPAGYLVTGGGNYCAGTSGVHVTLAGSAVGTTYQLFNGGSAVSGPTAGTGLSLDFGLETAGGTYTVVATNSGTGCTGNMTGSAMVGVNPMPTAYVVAGSGSTYCAGGTGIDITLNGSDIGTNYQLYNGTTPVGGTFAGSSAALDLGYRTATGTYTVVAVSSITSCSGNMTGSASVSIGALPVAFSLTGGGSFCADGSGVHVGISGSNTGVLYQLYKGGSLAGGGPVAGTGSALDFGLLSDPGVYTVIATNPASACANNMAGSALITVNALPAVYTVSGGGNYCASGTGVHVGLSGSASGNTYQLFRSGTLVSSVAGTGAALDFGLKTAAGSYTVVAENPTTSCYNNMSSSATVVVNALPAAFTVTGGGNYCPGGVGVHVGLANSVAGITYQLYNGSTISGSSVSGSGSSLDFGSVTGAGTYVVVGSNVTTGCIGNMSGSVPVVINALPNAYSVSGGGSYCSGTSGSHIGLSGSDAGVSYQARTISGPVGAPVIGTGAPLDLGAETTAGSYTVVANDPATTCSNNMTGTASVIVNPSVTPAVTINSGSSTEFCSGVLTNFTAVPVNGGTAPLYQWTVNTIVVATSNHYNYIPVNGDVIAVRMLSNALCPTTSTVSNALTLTVNPEQTPSVAITSTPGNEVCQGTVVNFSATATAGGTAPVYSWIKNGNTVDSTANFSYAPVSGDVVYCILSSNYHCRTANTASSNQESMIVDQPTAPIVSIATVPSNHIATGEQVTFTATASNAGATPQYQWFVNGVAVPGATFATYTGSNFNDEDSVCCQVTSSGACGGITNTSCTVLRVSGVGVKSLTLAGSDIKLIPNPNNGQFTIKGTLGTVNDQEVSFEVTDMIGQVVYTGKVIVHNGELNEKLQMGNVANGMYMLNLRSGTDSKVFHMVVEK